MKNRGGRFALLLVAGLTPSSATPAEPAFDPGLRRLAEVMGSLQFLSTLCGNGGEWRRRMEEILQAEAPDSQRRLRFVASFNGGYDAFAKSYRQCTPSARAAIALYVKEGEEITRSLGERFGN